MNRLYAVIAAWLNAPIEVKSVLELTFLPAGDMYIVLHYIRS